MDRNKMLYGVARFSPGTDARRAARIVDGFLRMYSIEDRRS
jgi:hypothetical protein